MNIKKTIKCHIRITSDVGHIQQILTGFTMLAKNNYIALTQEIIDDSKDVKDSANRWSNYTYYNVFVTINDKIHICYDTHDWNWIDPNILESVDYYFKRSYDDSYLEQEHAQELRRKVFPLGLNYHVESSGYDKNKIHRAKFYQGKERIKTILKGIGIDSFIPTKKSVERLSSLEGFPDLRAESKILFMARAWDPEKVESKVQADLIREINQTRARCIKQLRREYGSIFYGGLARDSYSMMHHSDVVLPDDESSNKRNYLKILQSYPICISTMGLNGSNGWKLGEYVAFSKAIVTEKLRYSVPGNFCNGTNYFEFNSNDDLLRVVHNLVQDVHLRNTLMMNNYHYYQSFLRPDVLILNTLAVAYC